MQEKYYYCGQACMKMFDSEINQSQDELWEITQMNSKEPKIWYTDPIGLLNGIKDVSDNQVRINVFPEIRFAGEWSKKRIAIISNYINYTLSFNIFL